MKSIVFLALFLGLACAAFTESDYQVAFINWMKEQGRSYGSHEFAHRYNAFKANMDYVAEWNAQGSATVLGLNMMADLTNEEYQKIYLGTHIDASDKVGVYEYDASAVAPEDVDWRGKGAVTGVKNQGQCGSCWSFSATGSMEGAHQIATGKLVSLSEQNLMDCSTSYGNQGCNGGLMDGAFKYVIANKGIDTEASYPYETKQGTCRYKAANSGATISSFTDIPSGNENSLTSAIDGRPVSVAIDASKQSFQLYNGGPYYESTCSSSRLDHGVLAVGYGTTSGQNTYTVKNSWGASWGSQGYIFMSRGRNNNCGIATSASYPRA